MTALRAFKESDVSCSYGPLARAVGDVHLEVLGRGV